VSGRPAAARLGAAVLLSAGLLASCAPPPPPAPSVDDLAVRYDAGRTRREECLRAMTADLVLRMDGRATGRLPGLSASLALAAPERARLRVSALFGTALDVCARGDSVLAWVPSERTALALGGAADTLGIAPPVQLFARAVGASWNPPREAWRTAAVDSLGLVLTWLEGADSVTLHVDRDAHPAAVRLAGAAGSVTVHYASWGREAGADWPGSVEVADGTGWVRVRVAVANVRPVETADEAWFALRLPANAKRLDWEGLREWLGEKRQGW
jgi:hypothetical protein